MVKASPFEPNTSALEAFILGVVEASINRILALDPLFLAELQQLSGKVVRVKTLEPYLVFYIIFSDSGIQVAPFYDGIVDARLKASAAKLLSCLFNQSVDLDFSSLDVMVSGDRDLVKTFFISVKRYDLWSVSKSVLSEWFPDLAHWPDVLDKLKTAQPDWVTTISDLPIHLQETYTELQKSLNVQQAMLEELHGIRQSLEVNQRKSSSFLPVGSSLLVGALIFLLGWLLGQGSIAGSGGSFLSLNSDMLSRFLQARYFFPIGLAIAGCAMLWWHYRSSRTT